MVRRPSGQVGGQLCQIREVKHEFGDRCGVPLSHFPPDLVNGSFAFCPGLPCTARSYWQTTVLSLRSFPCVSRLASLLVSDFRPWRGPIEGSRIESCFLAIEHRPGGTQRRVGSIKSRTVEGSVLAGTAVSCWYIALMSLTGPICGGCGHTSYVNPCMWCGARNAAGRRFMTAGLWTTRQLPRAPALQAFPWSFGFRPA